MTPPISPTSPTSSTSPTSPTSIPDLETIRENSSHREQSASPSPDPNPNPNPNPDPGFAPSDVTDFVTRVPERRSTHPTTPLTSQLKSSTGDIKSSKPFHRAASRPISTAGRLQNHARKPPFHRFRRAKSHDSEGPGPNTEFLRRSTGNTNASAPFEETEVWDHKAILSLDGGGIRGYSALLTLRALMAAIGELESNDPEDPAESSFHPLKPSPGMMADGESIRSNVSVPEISSTSPWLPCHYFDYAAGTSTGGLISIMLGRLRMNIDDCIRDYEILGDKIFGHSRWFHLRTWHFFWPRDKYDSVVLEKVVKDVVNRRVPYVATFPGGRNFSSDENRCRTVVLSYQKQRTKGVETPYLFRTYKHLRKSAKPIERLLDRNPGLAHDVPIYQVALATSAAPTYFKPAKIGDLEYLDGGFGANNPCMEIYDEVRKMNNNSESCIHIIVSIGTGKNNEVARFGGEGVSRYWNYLNFAKKWASESETTHTSMMTKQKHSATKFNYFRLNVEEGLGPMKLDEWKARGAMRLRLGRLIGRMRFPKPSAGGNGSRPGHENGTTTGHENGTTTGHENGTTTGHENGTTTGHENGTTTGHENGTTTGHENGTTTGHENGTTTGHENGTTTGHENGTVTGHEKPVVADPKGSLCDERIPKWFRPKNKTLEEITRCTENYLNHPERQEWIQECARILVKSRRHRAEMDPLRWEKTCFNAWYQCNVEGCPHAESEYETRDALRNHLLDKHKKLCTMLTTAGRDELTKRLDICKIMVR